MDVLQSYMGKISLCLVFGYWYCFMGLLILEFEKGILKMKLGDFGVDDLFQSFLLSYLDLGVFKW